MNDCAGWLRQQESQQLGTPREIAKGFSAHRAGSNPAQVLPSGLRCLFTTPQLRRQVGVSKGESVT